MPTTFSYMNHWTHRDKKVIHIYSNTIKKPLDIDTLLLPFFVAYSVQALSLPSLHSFSLPEQSTEGCKPSPSIPQPRFCFVCRALTARQTTIQPQNPPCDMRQVMNDCTSSSNRISHRRAVQTVVQNK